MAKVPGAQAVQVAAAAELAPVGPAVPILQGVPMQATALDVAEYVPDAQTVHDALVAVVAPVPPAEEVPAGHGWPAQTVLPEVEV